MHNEKQLKCQELLVDEISDRLKDQTKLHNGIIPSHIELLGKTTDKINCLVAGFLWCPLSLDALLEAHAYFA